MDRASVLEERVNDITGVLNAQHAELIDIVVELLADSRLWQGEGVWSMQNWLSWRCAVSTTTAKQIVVVAERAADLPISTDAFRRGELALDQIAAVARKAPSWADEQACGFAKRMTVHQLRRTMKYPFPNLDENGKEIVVDPVVVVPEADQPGEDGDEPNQSEVSADSGNADASDDLPAVGSAPTISEWFSQAFDDDGMFRLSLGTDYETGHIFMAALCPRRSADRNALFPVAPATSSSAGIKAAAVSPAVCKPTALRCTTSSTGSTTAKLTPGTWC